MYVEVIGSKLHLQMKVQCVEVLDYSLLPILDQWLSVIVPYFIFLRAVVDH